MYEPQHAVHNAEGKKSLVIVVEVPLDGREDVVGGCQAVKCPAFHKSNMLCTMPNARRA